MPEIEIKKSPDLSRGKIFVIYLLVSTTLLTERLLCRRGKEITPSG